MHAAATARGRAVLWATTSTAVCCMWVGGWAGGGEGWSSTRCQHMPLGRTSRPLSNRTFSSKGPSRPSARSRSRTHPPSPSLHLSCSAEARRGPIHCCASAASTHTEVKRMCLLTSSVPNGSTIYTQQCSRADSTTAVDACQRITEQSQRLLLILPVGRVLAESDIQTVWEE